MSCSGDGSQFTDPSKWHFLTLRIMEREREGEGVWKRERERETRSDGGIRVQMDVLMFCSTKPCFTLFAVTLFFVSF